MASSQESVFLLDNRKLWVSRKMWSHKFEEQSIRHPMYYVSKLHIDVIRSRIYLALIFDPEIRAIVVEITFNQCHNIEIMDHGKEETEDYLPSLLGVLNKTDEQGTRYHIGTDVTEVEFVSREKPAINWLDKTALELEYHPEILRLSDQDSKA